MTEQIGNKMCECHECTQARYRSSFQGQMDAAIRPAQISSDLSRLTSGLRELAEKWNVTAADLDKEALKFPVGFVSSALLCQAKLYRGRADELLALLPEATKEVPDGKV